jgi:hypothetical protein
MLCPQFFAPYASIGELAMPAAVYLLDIHMPGEHVQNYLSLVAPVLSSRDNIKVCRTGAHCAPVHCAGALPQAMYRTHMCMATAMLLSPT